MMMSRWLDRMVCLSGVRTVPFLPNMAGTKKKMEGTRSTF
jgi:hypothetical protein